MSFETITVLLVTSVAVAAMWGEHWLAKRWLGRSTYSLAQTIDDLLCAAGYGVVEAGLLLSQTYGYAWVLEHLAPFRLPIDHPATWVLGFVLVDLTLYWRHLLLHRIALLWTAHVVHHQGRQYTFSLALRTGWTQPLTTWPLVALLGVTGLPLEVVVGTLAVNLLWQVFIHTDIYAWPKWMEWVLVTPSTHRVHHACNPHYIDRNYGAVFGVWDHLFRTFTPEEERPVLGVVHPGSRWDPIEDNLVPFTDLVAHVRAADDWRTAWRRCFGPLSPSPLQPEHPGPPASVKAPARRALLGAATTLLCVGSLAYVGIASSLSTPVRLLLAAGLLVAMAWIGRSLNASATRRSSSTIGPA